MISRRDLLQGILLTGGFSLLPFAKTGFALAAPATVDTHLVVVMLRGAMDGLSAVVPHGDDLYYGYRPNIAIPRVAATHPAYLTSYFALHPALVPLKRHYVNGKLAIIHASGSRAGSRSHFQAQDIIETALVSPRALSPGWLNSLTQLLPDNGSVSRAVNFGDRMPRILRGEKVAISVPIGKINTSQIMTQPQTVQDAVAALYRNDPNLTNLFNLGLKGTSEISDDISKEMIESANGAPPAEAFVTLAGQAGNLIAQNRNIQNLFMDIGGWDTHVRQGGVDGILGNMLQHLAQGLDNMVTALGAEFNRTTIIVLSEFGRTARENGGMGTDHGFGNVAFVLGGRVNGGKIYGSWPGLSAAALNENRDLAITTDFRSIVGRVIRGSFGLTETEIANVLPDYAYDPALAGLMQS